LLTLPQITLMTLIGKWGPWLCRQEPEENCIFFFTFLKTRGIICAAKGKK